jgi:hypothetical protein
MFSPAPELLVGFPFEEEAEADMTEILIWGSNTEAATDELGSATVNPTCTQIATSRRPGTRVILELAASRRCRNWTRN